MSIKSTRCMGREEAVRILSDAISSLSNKTLGNILDVVADSEETGWCSRFDNFLVDGTEPSSDELVSEPGDTTSFWIICYPKSDRNKLSIAEIQYSSSYEEREYSRASETRFISRERAVRVAKSLAKTHGLEFVSDEEADHFLD